MAVCSGLHAWHGATGQRNQEAHKMNQVKQTVVALGVLAMLAGCTGDESTVSSSGNGYEVSSGLAQKGPLLRGSSVTVNELNTSTLQPSGKSYTFEVLDDLGTFKPSNIRFSSAYLENTALGYYFNELTGQQSSDMVYLRGLSYLGTDRAVNLNVLSTFVKNRIKNLVTTKPVKTFVVARPQAERELLGAFYIYNAVDLLPGTTVGSVVQPKTFMELDLSKKRAGDQILAAISGMVAQIGQTGSGVNYFLNQVETDLADDGLINNSPNFPVSVQQQLSDAAKNTDFGAVAANLNAFYKTNYSATDLSQWVDTSGGVDKVIDKYKFSASNVPVGTESKSPEYVAGSEDAGQCFSVSAGKLYRNGVAVATGTVKAVKGDKLVIGLTGNAGGTTYSGFLQRSAPDAKGVCPQVVPNTGLTRVKKYTAATAVATRTGYVTTNFGGLASIGRSLLIQPDGKIVLTGNTVDKYAVTTVRYLPNGDLDSEFGVNGYVQVGIAASPRPFGLLMKSGGELVIYGDAYYSGASSSDAFVLQLKPSGEKDTDFDPSGVKLIRPGDYQSFNAGLVDRDNNIMLAGSSFNGVQADFLLAKIFPNGIFDTSFGGGVFTQDFPLVGGYSGDEASSINLLPDGKVVALGKTGNSLISMAKYSPDGRLDGNFGVGGIFNSGIPPTCCVNPVQSLVLNDGSIITGLANQGDFYLAKFKSDGQFDASFGGGGVLISDFGDFENLSSIALQSDGKILAAGYNNSGGSIIVARFFSNGALDGTFGVGGKVIYKRGVVRDVANSLAIDVSGKILVGGYSDLDYMVVRLNSDGSLDKTFGSN